MKKTVLFGSVLVIGLAGIGTIYGAQKIHQSMLVKKQESIRNSQLAFDRQHAKEIVLYLNSFDASTKTLSNQIDIVANASGSIVNDPMLMGGNHLPPQFTSDLSVFDSYVSQLSKQVSRSDSSISAEQSKLMNLEFYNAPLESDLTNLNNDLTKFISYQNGIVAAGKDVSSHYHQGLSDVIHGYWILKGSMIPMGNAEQDWQYNLNGMEQTVQDIQVLQHDFQSFK